MASIKELRLRIKSLKNTNKITAAMKLVATSKLKKSQDSMKANKPYSEKLNTTLKRVVQSLSTENLTNPLLEKRTVKKTRYYVFSSDKGLCGSFNNALIKYYSRHVENVEANFETFTVGKKVNDFFQKKDQYNVTRDFGVLTKTLDENQLKELVDEAIQDYISGEVDQVVVVYNKFESVLSQVPTSKTILPIEAPSTGSVDTENEYIYEPSAEELLADILPRYVYVLFYQTLLENSAGEHGARMTSMESATKNSRDLIDNFTIIMNRARQAAITTELTEIVSGAESLKG